MGIVPAPAAREQGGPSMIGAIFLLGPEQLYPCWGA